MQAVAAIDVGSNATRLSIVWVSSIGLVINSEFHRYPLRLGADVFSQGAVTSELQRQLVETFVAMAALLQERDVRTYRAVATSAMRDAQNGPAVVRQIFERCGLQLEIISGAQESRLARAALLRAVGTLEADALMLDLGGGSMELDRSHRRRGRSLPLGTVRLLERFPELGKPLSAPALAKVRAAVGAEVRKHFNKPKPAALGVGTGGNLDTLAQLLAAPGMRLPTINLAELEAFADAVAGMSNVERVQVYKVRSDRADLILPAVLVILALVDIFGLKHIVVPGTGLREAILHDLVLPTEAGQSARRLLGTGHDHAAFANRSAKLARELFADLAAVHGLWPPALQPFLTAVYAWYFGSFLEPGAAEKHAIYLLNEVDSLEIDAPARRAAVFAVRALRGMLPAWDGPEAEHSAALAIAGLLRLALAMAPLARRTAALSVDVLSEPVVITADLSTPLEASVTEPLEAAWGRRIVVR